MFCTHGAYTQTLGTNISAVFRANLELVSVLLRNLIQYVKIIYDKARTNTHTVQAIRSEHGIELHLFNILLH